MYVLTCCVSVCTYVLCKCMYLRVVEEFPVLFVPPAALHEYIQLCDDLVLKLQTQNHILEQDFLFHISYYDISVLI